MRINIKLIIYVWVGTTDLFLNYFKKIVAVLYVRSYIYQHIILY